MKRDEKVRRGLAALSEGELALPPACSPVPLAERKGGG